MATKTLLLVFLAATVGFLLADGGVDTGKIDVPDIPGGNQSDGALLGDGTDMNQSLGGDFDRIEFYENGTADLYFEQFHDMDGFLFRYHAQSGSDQALLVCSAPRSGHGGPVRFDAVGKINESGVDYPDRKFAVVGLEGDFTPCNKPYQMNLIQDYRGAQRVMIPERFNVTE